MCKEVIWISIHFYRCSWENVLHDTFNKSLASSCVEEVFENILVLIYCHIITYVLAF